VGAVTEIIRKQERRDAAKRASALRDFLWLPPITLLYYAVAVLPPHPGSRLLDALLWVAFGAALIGLLLVASRLVRRVRAHATWSVRAPVEFISLMTVALCGQRLFPVRLWGVDGLGVLACGLFGGGILGFARWLDVRSRRRRENARAT
jgi:hypothetical protein